MNIETFMQGAHALAFSEAGRLAATGFIVGVTALLTKFLQKRAQARYNEDTEIAHGRGNFVLAKNLVIVIAVFLICSIWASKIAGAALSLAAVTGAVLIVSKEFLTNILGSGMLAISRPYRVGDFIELDGVSGRVVDTDLLATTVTETMDGSQITGRTVAIPHSLLLVKPVRNLTATGSFVINMFKMPVSVGDDLEKHEKLLLDAAKEVCSPWLIAAAKHLKRVESRELVDLPSSEPRVIIQIKDFREATLSLRYPCRPNDKVKVEQAIIRLYLKKRGPIPTPEKSLGE